MLIVCPNCATGYEVKPQALGATGRTVRCAACRCEWTAAASRQPPVAMRPASPEPVAAAPPGPLAAERDHDPPPAPNRDGEAAQAIALPGAAQAAGLAPQAPFGGDIVTVEAPALAPVVEDIETAARRRGAAPRRSSGRLDRLRLPILPTVIVAQLVAIGAVIAWRDAVVRVMPQTASLFRGIGLPVNLRGLAFSDLQASQDTHDGVTMLIIDGMIRNIAGAPVKVPRLRFSLRDASGTELLSWTAPPDQGTLGAGEMLPFRSRIAAPPADGRDVSVRFLNRQDFIPGAS